MKNNYLFNSHSSKALGTLAFNLEAISEHRTIKNDQPYLVKMNDNNLIYL